MESRLIDRGGITRELMMSRLKERRKSRIGKSWENHPMQPLQRQVQRPQNDNWSSTPEIHMKILQRRSKILERRSSDISVEMVQKRQTRNFSKILQKRPDYITGNWSSLPDDILLEIFKRLHCFVDHVTIRSICAHWRSSILLCKSLSLNIHLALTPHLLLTDHNRNPLPGTKYALFYDMNIDRVHNIFLPEFSHNYCCGSSQGWLVFLGYRSPSMSILNPFTNVSIQLPPLTTFPDVLGFDILNTGKEYSISIASNSLQPAIISIESMHRHFIYKVVLSPNPTSTNYTAMAMFGFNDKRLAICKSGSKQWTLVKGVKLVEDIIHYKGRFFAFNVFNYNVHDFLLQLFQICNLDGHGLNPHSPPIARIFASTPFTSLYVNEIYLAELSGNLILLHRHKSTVDFEGEERWYRTSGFEVYRLDNDSREWVPVISFRNHSLFLGAKSVLGSDSPRCRPNCIYFTSEQERYEFGVFNLKTSTVELYRPRYPRALSSPSIWFTPSFS